VRAAVTVVGGGIAGLVASIACAEAGVEVRLFEAHRQLGGRARSSRGPFVTNLGPHALYCDGPWWAWLAERELLPAVAKPPFRGARFRHGQTAGRLPPLALVAKELACGDGPRRSTSISGAGPRSSSEPNGRRCSPVRPASSPSTPIRGGCRRRSSGNGCCGSIGCLLPCATCSEAGIRSSWSSRAAPASLAWISKPARASRRCPSRP
jgi:hypothetical protein